MSWHREKQLEQSESRLSAQRGELSAVREACQKGEVERQVLDGERAQLSEALASVRRKTKQNKDSLIPFTLRGSVSVTEGTLIVLPGGEQERRALSAAEQAAV